MLSAALIVASLVVVSAAPVQVGPRPYWLIDQMRDGPLKSQLGEQIYE